MCVAPLARNSLLAKSCLFEGRPLPGAAAANDPPTASSWLAPWTCLIDGQHVKLHLWVCFTAREAGDETGQGGSGGGEKGPEGILVKSPS